jgi:hypothetical protein
MNYKLEQMEYNVTGVLNISTYKLAILYIMRSIYEDIT